ncbi:C45 family autoproteolytic acyltransferase/hydolase [Arthrobacter koreensis]|uniref:C45 family autoproteolytic acyltransferase/hydrolase n=1 Tax=Arthrobacter koreensis TaxID=199136 RepID=A0ABY6FTE3_9MICC|nr:C45 family peptidase [Arthrobacter koreensis]MEB7447929.1 C45 family autoproteolytic acyltransferase/hydrolase [Arthrobacter koreensis]UYB36477.1 C45 family autoproteolytic acyltransferase/hydrolase [Arthrobacter koreensis]
MSGFPHPSPALITIAADSARERGVQRGQAARDALSSAWQVYADLFAAGGIGAERVEHEALASLAAVRQWIPDLAAEIDGTAAGAGLPVWQTAALNARTEILSLAKGRLPGECSTVISTIPGRVFSAQTWDWHEELAAAWHLQSVAHPGGRFVGMTEYGILGKIGVNSFGVGVHLNVLGHREDTPGAVPVHVAAAAVLYSARTLDEAVDLLTSAPVTTSSCISVVTQQGARMVELSPAGAQVVGGSGNYLLHTNHFLSSVPAAGERTELYQPDSDQRMDLLRRRSGGHFDPVTTADLVPYLCSNPGDGADLCCVPAAGARFGDRWRTLATALIEPEAAQLRVSPGAPTEAGPGTWRVLSAFA